MARIRNGDFCGLLPNRANRQRLRFASCPAIVCLLHGGLIRPNGKDMSDPTQTLFFHTFGRASFFFTLELVTICSKLFFNWKEHWIWSHFEYQSHNGFDGVKATSSLSSLCWCHRWRVFKPSWWRRTLGYQCYDLAWHGCWNDWNSFSSDAMLSRNTGIPIGSLDSLQIGFFKRLWRLRTKGNWHLATISPQHCIDCKAHHLSMYLNWHHGKEPNLPFGSTSKVSRWPKPGGSSTFVALQLVGRDNVSAEHGCENHRAVEPVQILDAEGIGDDIWLDPNDPSDQTGGRFNSLWLLLNYNLGSQGARALGESLANSSISPSPVSILILVPTILARRCQSPGWVTGQIPAFHCHLYRFWSWFQQSWLTRCQSPGWVTGQIPALSPVSILILVPTILARRCQSPGWVTGQIPAFHRHLSLATGDWLNALLFLSQGCWNSECYERMDTSYYLVLKKELIDDVYTSILRLRSVSNLVVMTIFGRDPRAP